jgi:hypothetical protein
MERGKRRGQIKSRRFLGFVGLTTMGALGEFRVKLGSETVQFARWLDCRESTPHIYALGGLEEPIAESRSFNTHAGK